MSNVTRLHDRPLPPPDGYGPSSFGCGCQVRHWIEHEHSDPSRPLTREEHAADHHPRCQRQRATVAEVPW